MRVHDEVGADAALAEREVLLPHDVAHHALLPVPAATRSVVVVVADVGAGVGAAGRAQQVCAFTQTLVPCRCPLLGRCPPLVAVDQMR